MKKILKKISEKLKLFYGYGIAAAVILGGLTAFGYMAALIIGGETGAAICSFIYEVFFPVLIFGSNVIVLIGLLAMYLSAEKTMVIKKKDKRKSQ